MTTPTKPVELKRIERDTTTAVYKMGRDELITACIHGKGALKDQAREELAIRQWNRLVKRSQ